MTVKKGPTVMINLISNLSQWRSKALAEQKNRTAECAEQSKIAENAMYRKEMKRFQDSFEQLARLDNAHEYIKDLDSAPGQVEVVTPGSKGKTKNFLRTDVQNNTTILSVAELNCSPVSVLAAMSPNYGRHEEAQDRTTYEVNHSTGTISVLMENDHGCDRRFVMDPQSESLVDRRRQTYANEWTSVDGNQNGWLEPGKEIWRGR
jgi:hypothetical protein